MVKFTDDAAPTGGPTTSDKIPLVDVSDTTDDAAGSSKTDTIGNILALTTLQVAFNGGQSITIADTANKSITLTQNDTTNNPDLLKLVNTATGNSLQIDTDGNARSIFIDSAATTNTVVDIDANNTSGTVMSIRNAAVQTTGILLELYSQETTSANTTLDIKDYGTGDTMFIRKYGSSGRALYFENSSTTSGAFTFAQQTVLGANNHSVILGSGAAQTGGAVHLVSIELTNAASTAGALEVVNSGTGTGLYVRGGNMARAIYVETTSLTTGKGLDITVSGLTTGYGAYVYSNSSGFTSSNGLARVYVDHASATGIALVVTQDGTGTAVNIDANGTGKGMFVDHDDTGTNPSVHIDRDGNNAAAVSGLKVDVDNAGAGGVVGIDLSSMSTGEANFKFVADATDPTGGGGAATGRIAIDIGGSVKYLAYY
jgi:hypothetical protein